MKDTRTMVGNGATPILLYNDECGVCRSIARWVKRSASGKAGSADLVALRPIGADPEALRSLSPDLDIWDAYATIHLMMPDGSMKLGGEAVAEVLRDLPKTRWFAWVFALGLFGWRPFQTILDAAYALLSDVRPLFGCESCGTPNAGVRAIRWAIRWVQSLFGRGRHPSTTAHFSMLAPAARPARLGAAAS
jgi:predicted DCC family thiol-disulfide oxidoreductase YuxK